VRSAGVDTENRESAKERKREITMITGRLFEAESWEAIGCALEVHRELGPGFLESVYHNAMAVSLVGKEIPFESERRATIWFQGVEVGHHCFDLVVRESVVIELQAVDDLAEIHFAKLRSYLRAAGLRVGLLINFNAPKLVVRRVVNRARFRDSSIDADSRNFPLDSADVR
jgi:GxxExxY protein